MTVVRRSTRRTGSIGRLGVLLALLAAPVVVSAQQAPAFRVAADNDYFDFPVAPDHRPDDNYTQGARVTAGVARVVGWRRLAPRLAACDDRAAVRCGSTTWEIGQLMYTPSIDEARPAPGERPYVGFLYGSMAARVERERRLTTASLLLGVTGPPSLAAAAQTAFHRSAGFRRPLGWDSQLPTEVAGLARVEERLLVASLGTAASRLADVVASGGVNTGTWRTSADATVGARVGYGIAHSWRTGHRTRLPLVGAYVLGEGRTDAVARDLPLAGSTFRESQHVRHEPVTAALTWGFGLRVRHVAAEYRLQTTTREYRTGPRRHPVGTIALELRR